MYLLNAPSATPSSAQNASTRAGLITRLKELTIDSANAPRPPIIMAPYSCEASCWVMVELTAGVITQVTNAATSTTSSEMPVFWTTLSMVIGRVAARVPGVPGVPTLQVEGSGAVEEP